MFNDSGHAGRPLALALAVLAASVLSGCASITGSELQLLSLQAWDKDGAPVAGADCKLSNDKGTWYAKPPASPTVTRSAEDLMVNCEAAGQAPGTVRAISRANAGMAGNILFGGVVGAIIDHNKGTAYDYPSAIGVVFGASKVIDKNDDSGASPAAQSATVPAPAPQNAPLVAMAAGPNAPASATLPSTGASFRYAWTEQQYGRRTQEIQIRVAGVDDWTVMELFSADGRSPMRTEVHARELAFASRLLAEGQSMLEFSPYLQLRGQADLPPIANPSGYSDSGGSLWRISARLGGTEPVTVPAGTFNALRVELRGERDLASSNTGTAVATLSRRFEYTAWYVPEIKRYVKSRHRSWNMSSMPFGDELVELLEYRPN